MDIEHRLQIYASELRSLNNNSSSGKPERHERADEILTSIIRLLWDEFENIGVVDINEILQAYEDVPKWYS